MERQCPEMGKSAIFQSEASEEAKHKEHPSPEQDLTVRKWTLLRAFDHACRLAIF